MKAKLISAAALAALVILGAGCKKLPWRPVAGERIHFRAVSDFGKDPKSKTAYSGEYFSVEGYQNKFERIDWVEGDDITIAYLSHTQGTNFIIASDDYKITAVSNAGDEKSFATIAPTGGPYGVDGEGWGGNGLKWQDNETHQFYACYPGVSKDSDYVFELGAEGIVAKVPFDYPATQVLTRSETDENVFLPDMKYAAMLHSDEEGISLPSGREKVINLSFSPHFTAFEFQAAAKEGDSFTLNSFTLSSENTFITGRFLWSMDPEDNNEWHDFAKEGATYKTASVDFTALNEGDPLPLTDSQPITFTVLVCCPDVAGRTNYLEDLTIIFNINKDGAPVDRKLKLANNYGNYLSFRHNVKHRIKGLRIPLEIGPGSLWYEGVDAGSYTDLQWPE